MLPSDIFGCESGPWDLIPPCAKVAESHVQCGAFWRHFSQIYWLLPCHCVKSWVSVQISGSSWRPLYFFSGFAHLTSVWLAWSAVCQTYGDASHVGFWRTALFILHTFQTLRVLPLASVVFGVVISTGPEIGSEHHLQCVDCDVKHSGPVAPSSVNCTVSWLTDFTLLLLADVARELYLNGWRNRLTDG